MKYAELLKTL